MTDLASTALTRPVTQLPVDWYFSPEVYALEQALFFANGPGYVGHELLVPEPGDYHVLPWRDNGQMLVRTPAGVQLVSNVCRHRQAVMLHGRGNARNIVCPVHRWTYDLDGRLLGAPHFADNPCLDLARTPLESWNGLLFEGPRTPAADLAPLRSRADLDFSGHLFDHVEIDELPVNWKTFIEVYLEDYHVEPFHPGLGNFVSCDDLAWELGDWYSVQTVGVRSRLARPGSKAFERYHKAVLEHYRGELPAHGAVWFLYFPNVMIEWYPHVLIVSSVFPRGPEHCTNVMEFYYPEEIALFEREFVEAEREAYLETAREDAEICRRMNEGRKVLWRAGRSEVGPYQSPMEDGMQHFHEFLRRHLGPRL